MECFQGTDHYGVLSSSGTLPRDIKYLPKWCGGRGNLVSLFLIHTGKTVFLGRLYLLYQLCEFRQIVCKSSARMFQKAQPPPLRLRPSLSKGYGPAYQVLRTRPLPSVLALWETPAPLWPRRNPPYLPPPYRFPTSSKTRYTSKSSTVTSLKCLYHKLLATTRLVARDSPPGGSVTSPLVLGPGTFFSFPTLLKYMIMGKYLSGKSYS